VIAVPELIAAVSVSDRITYPNGDDVQYLEVLFRCHAAGGAARVNDFESVEVGWHAVDTLPDLPDLHERTIGRIRLGLAAQRDRPASFAFSGLDAVLGPVAL